MLLLHKTMIQSDQNCDLIRLWESNLQQKESPQDFIYELLNHVLSRSHDAYA